MTRFHRSRRDTISLLVLPILALIACRPANQANPANRTAAASPSAAPATPAVLYCSVDETFARQILDLYRQRTSRPVDLVFDTEAGKTTGLVKRLRLEKDRPRADVFWSGEQSQTLLLAREGLLAPYSSPSAADIPEAFQDPQHLWTGIALRARVLAYDPARIRPDELPRTWAELAEPRFAANLAIANPLFGTTRGHVSAMLVLWGEDRFRTFLTRLVAGGAVVADGNSAAVRKLLDGNVRLAMTDSDDVLVARARGHSIEMIYPDMGDGGTMLIPNTVALIAGAPHPEQGRALIDFLLTAEVEELLAHSESANYPVRPALRTRLGIELPPASKVAGDDLAEAMPRAVELAREILLK